jgi:hypothetical protein
MAGLSVLNTGPEQWPPNDHAVGSRVDAFVSDFAAWIGAVIEQWATLVTGGVVVAIFILIQTLLGHAIALAALPWLAIAFFIAAFQAWRKERNAARVATERPRLIPRIESLVVEDMFGARGPRTNAKGPLVCATISVANEGYESTAARWEMFLDFNGAEVRVIESDIGEYAFVGVQTEETSIIFDFEQLLARATDTPVRRGERRTGKFIGYIPATGFSLDDLRTLRIRCVDFQESSYVARLGTLSPDMGHIQLQDKRMGMPPPAGFRTPPVTRPAGRQS